MNDVAAQELQSVVNRMREKATGKRQNAENLRGQIEQMQRRITGLLNDAADLDQGADAIEQQYMMDQDNA